MEIGYLIERLKTLIYMSPNESDAAFQYFIKSVYKKIKNYQVLKIPQMGFFQVKTEPLPRMERKGISDKSLSKQLLVFVPLIESNDNINKVFLNIEIDSVIDPDYENVDKAFNIGFNKPIIPHSGSSVNSFAKKIKDFSTKNNFEEKIDELLIKSELIDDFNIFTNYLDSSTSENNKLADIGDTVKEIFETTDENTNVDEEIISPPDLEKTEIDSDDIPELLDKDFTEEDIEKLFSNEELEKISIPNEIGNELESVSKEPENQDNESSIVNTEEVLNVPEDKIEFEIEEENQDNADKKKTMFDELEEVLSSKSESTEIIDELANEQAGESLNVQGTAKFDNSDVKIQVNKTNHFYHSFIFWFGVIFFIILAAVIFFMNIDYFIAKKNSPARKTITQKVNMDVPKTDSAKLLSAVDSQSVKENLLTQIEKKTELDNTYRTPVKDIRINNQIYSDGSKYSVQVSSWLDKSIAENEVKKFRARGFDAFIYKALVKGNLWSRVRIGYFNSGQEADRFLINNQLKEK